MEQDESRAFIDRVRRLRSSFYREVEPHRPGLYRYCRRLTGNPFDAEDLHQEAVLRAFAKLSERFEPIANPRAYLFRIATHLWIDEKRRSHGHEETQPLDASDLIASAPSTSRVELRDGAAELLRRLSPREAAIFVLRDVFEFSVREAAGIAQCSEAAVKMATVRARRHLEAPELEDPIVKASEDDKALLERFVDAFEQRDLPALMELLDENAQARVLGCAEESGRDEIQRGSLHYALASDVIHGATVEERQGIRFLAFWYKSEQGRVVRDLARIRFADERASRLDFFYFSPDVIAEVCGDLGLPHATNGYAVVEDGWWNDAEPAV